MDVGYDGHAISMAIQNQVSNGRYSSDVLYGNGQAGQRIAQLLSEVPLLIEKRLTY